MYWSMVDEIVMIFHPLLGAAIRLFAHRHALLHLRNHWNAGINELMNLSGLFGTMGGVNRKWETL